jgi:uncharacterized Ntn-hydrolase superfamily protein
MQRARFIWSFFVAATGLGSASLVSATYSIAATDSATQQVGGAVTSCVGSLDVGVVYGSAPGYGVIHAQASLDRMYRGKNRAIDLLEQGVAPSDIIAQITTSSVDPGFASRQYGVVDLQGRAAGYTGAQAMMFKADRQGRSGTFTYSVQGNILTSQRVLDQASRAFEGDGCDLAERLMVALEAGGENGEGDSRCTGDGIPTDAAFIQVDRPGEPAGSWLKLSVSNTGPDNPLPRLRAMFEAWRKNHPCPPIVLDAGMMGGEDAGADPPLTDAGSQPTGAGGRAGMSSSAAGASGASGMSSVPVAGIGAVQPLAGTVAASAGAAAISGSPATGTSASPVSSAGAPAGTERAASGCNVRGVTARGPGDGSGAFELLLAPFGAFVLARRRRRVLAR